MLRKKVLEILTLAVLVTIGSGEYSIACTTDRHCQRGMSCVPGLGPQWSRVKSCLQKCSTSADCIRQSCNEAPVYCSPKDKVCRCFCEKTSDCPPGHTCHNEGCHVGVINKGQSERN